MKPTKRDRTYLQSFNRSFPDIGKRRIIRSWSELLQSVRNSKDIAYSHSPMTSIDPTRGFISYKQFQGRLLRDLSYMTAIPIEILSAPYTSKWKIGWFERMSEEVEC